MELTANKLREAIQRHKLLEKHADIQFKKLFTYLEMLSNDNPLSIKPVEKIFEKDSKRKRKHSPDSEDEEDKEKAPAADPPPPSEWGFKRDVEVALRVTVENLDKLKNGMQFFSKAHVHEGMVWQLVVEADKKNLHFYPAHSGPKDEYISPDRFVGNNIFDEVLLLVQAGEETGKWKRLCPHHGRRNDRPFSKEFIANPKNGFVKDNTIIAEMRLTYIRNMIPIFDKPFISSFTFIVEGKKVYVSKELLAMQSSFFSNFFYEEHKDVKEFELADVKYDEFVEFLEALYKNEHEIREKSLESMIVLAARFEVPSVMQKCVVTFLEAWRKSKYSSNKDKFSRSQLIRLAGIGGLTEAMMDILHYKLPIEDIGHLGEVQTSEEYKKMDSKTRDIIAKSYIHDVAKAIDKILYEMKDNSAWRAIYDHEDVRAFYDQLKEEVRTFIKTKFDQYEPEHVAVLGSAGPAFKRTKQLQEEKEFADYFKERFRDIGRRGDNAASVIRIEGPEPKAEGDNVMFIRRFEGAARFEVPRIIHIKEKDQVESEQISVGGILWTICLSTGYFESDLSLWLEGEIDWSREKEFEYRKYWAELGIPTDTEPYGNLRAQFFLVKRKGPAEGALYRCDEDKFSRENLEEKGFLADGMALIEARWSFTTRPPPPFHTPSPFSTFSLVAEGRRFHISSEYLAMHWKHFFKLYYAQDVNENTNKKNVMVLENVRQKDLLHFLCLVYGAFWDQKKLIQKNEKELLELTERMDIQVVKNLCSEQLFRSTLVPLKKLTMADRYDLLALRLQAAHTVRHMLNYKQMKQQGQFAGFGERTKELLDLDLDVHF